MGRWKDGAQCAVMLTFDVDAETLWLAGELTNLSKPGMLSHGTYGAKVAVGLILDLLDEFGIKATFFVPGWTAERHREIIARIPERGHELGHHGWLHELPTSLTREREEEVLRLGLEMLIEVGGARPVGYRSPAWEFSANTLELLQAHGFLYSSNLMDHFLPYVHPGSGLVELPVQWILDDAPFFLFRTTAPSRPISSAANVLQVWQEEFAGIYQQGGLFNLTMHPQLIGRPGRLLMLRDFLRWTHRFPDVWYATGREVAEFTAIGYRLSAISHQHEETHHADVLDRAATTAEQRPQADS